MAFYTDSLPDFPWDKLVPARKRAAAHPGGVCDLTIGTPVDDTPGVVQSALGAATNAHGYPLVVGTPELRTAIRDWMARRRGITAPVEILPTIGSKEMVGLLPSLIGLGPGSRIGFPHVAYPTYDVGARLAGAEPVLVDTGPDVAGWPTDLDMLWLNSPANPTGHVLSADQLRAIVAWAREHDVIVASDECYAELCWQGSSAPSLLADEVCGGNDAESVRGLLMVYSLSKQSNMAGYRGAFLAGDPQIVTPMIELRKHLGFMVPAPVQQAMVAALGDDEHVRSQREVYEARRTTLLSALDGAGLHNDPDSVAGLYLWARAEGASSWDVVNACAELGIVVAPGTFYGEAGDGYVRMALTAPDAVINEAAQRLENLPEALKRISPEIS
ncbi:succinyldiaminopimelate transaminase [Trueperella bialowiezensis]|uniref:LL-diaminopimelate aminotransferase n=1 Tax=Trueperella bialowiezensis TaxID=312285 RepID=A0A3S5EW05_9ACTO|nr:succinyldiaminopimelate transaminase [Trueperella bialowiezensis]VEI12946.1 LL-diaminopimelate aminotransferase [Trueperella bialowiezensis]